MIQQFYFCIFILRKLKKTFSQKRHMPLCLLHTVHSGQDAKITKASIDRRMDGWMDGWMDKDVVYVQQNITQP